MKLTARVIRILNASSLILNVGEQDGAERGMRFAIFTPSEEIVDPETGEPLGTLRSRKATVELRSVYPRFSVAFAPSQVRRVGSDPLSTLTGRTERVQGTFPVAPEEVDPLPTGSEVRVGDVAEMVESSSRTTPPAPTS
jgi:hypothetical protein